MQLLTAIVQAEDADLLVDRLIEQGHRVTRINSMGSFLMRGNATVLVGVDDSLVESVLQIMRATCHSRTTFINAVPPVEAVAASLPIAMPLEVVVGGAVVFSFPVQRFLRLRGGSAPPAADHQPSPVSQPTSTSTTDQKDKMQMVLAILQNDDADIVAGGLIAAGHRVTRLNTAGGFLRRGNVTLLVGVEAERTDNVLRIIQANCQLRTEARRPEAGMPMYSATVFVLDAAHFSHV
jgi:uncharacterized protein YaaQ